MVESQLQLTVLHGKFAKYLSWSQPFLYNLIQQLGQHTRNVIICNRTENLGRFPTPEVHTLHSRYLNNESLAAIAAAAIVERWNPDLLHAHFGWSGLRMVPLRQFLQKPLITTFGGKDVGQQMYQPGYDLLYRRLLDASDRIICVSNDLKRQVISRGVDDDRVVVIHRGTDIDRFSYVDRGDRSSKDRIRLLMVGRLVEKKGHRFALEAVSKLHRSGLALHLTIVGVGEESDALKRLARDLGIRRQVTFAGSTDDAGIVHEYSNADILLQPSITGAEGDTEGLPNVVVEAGATGLPTIATRHGGIAEAVRHRETGLLVEERDVAGLAESIREFTNDRSRRLDMGRAAAAFVRAHFDLTRQVARHVEVYHQAVDGAAGDPSRVRRLVADNEYFAALRRVTGDTGAGEEATIAGQLDKLNWAFSSRRDRPVFDEAVPWYMGRWRGAILVVPRFLRVRLRQLLQILVDYRKGTDLDRRDDSNDALGRATIDFVSGGDSLSEIDPGRDVPRSPQEVEADPKPTDGDREGAKE